MTEVDRYFSEVPADRQALLRQLHELILGLYPDAQVDLSHKMPTYRAKDGWVALANQKRYVSLYTCGAHHLVAFRESCPEIKTGKGCINFNPKNPLPLAAIKGVVRHAIEHPK